MFFQKSNQKKNTAKFSMMLVKTVVKTYKNHIKFVSIETFRCLSDIRNTVPHIRRLVTNI